MKTYKKFVAGTLLLGVFAIATPALAGPFDWQIVLRNFTDTTDVINVLPKPATTTIALVGSSSVEPQGMPRWYYPDPTQFGINFSGPDPLDGTAKTLSINAVDWSIVTGLSDLLNAKANQTDMTSAASAIVTLQSQMGNLYSRSISTSTSRTIATTTGASGWQVSSSFPADVHYSTTMVSTASIAGNSQGSIVLEIAATNATSSSAWTEVGRCTNGQALSLAVTLQSIQTTACQLNAFVPTGWYVKLRSITTSGTPAFTWNSGQEVLH